MRGKNRWDPVEIDRKRMESTREKMMRVSREGCEGAAEQVADHLIQTYAVFGLVGSVLFGGDDQLILVRFSNLAG